MLNNKISNCIFACHFDEKIDLILIIHNMTIANNHG